jgi:hypothetical protein
MSPIYSNQSLAQSSLTSHTNLSDLTKSSKLSTNTATNFQSKNIVNLTNNTTYLLNPRVIAIGNNVYVIWLKTDAPGGGFLVPSTILFKRSIDGGRSFSDAVALSNRIPGWGAVPDLEIAATGNNVYVVWTEPTGNNDNVHFEKSSNNGSSFGHNLVIGNSTGYLTVEDLKIAATGNNVYVVWQGIINGFTDRAGRLHEGQSVIHLAKSQDNGIHFNRTTEISSSMKSGWGHPYHNINIAATDNNVYVVWQNGTLAYLSNGTLAYGHSSILFKRATN